MAYSTPRRFPRVTLRDSTAVVSELWQRDGSLHAGLITVLGEGGAFLETTEAFDVGSTLGICFTPPGSRIRLVCGAVVRDQRPEPPGVGVEFVLSDRHERERLSYAVARCSS